MPQSKYRVVLYVHSSGCGRAIKLNIPHNFYSKACMLQMGRGLTVGSEIFSEMFSCLFLHALNAITPHISSYLILINTTGPMLLVAKHWLSFMMGPGQKRRFGNYILKLHTELSAESCHRIEFERKTSIECISCNIYYGEKGNFIRFELSDWPQALTLIHSNRQLFSKVSIENFTCN
jgi:hypothetical protein